MAQVISVVLAGGHSTRMGADKANLTVNNESWLQRALRTSSACKGVGASAVSGGQLSYAVPDIEVNGPLAGIVSVLTEPSLAESRGYVFVPVDMPFMTAEALSSLVETGLNKNLPTCFEDCWLPLFLPNSQKLLALANDTLKNKNGAIKTMLHEAGYTTVSRPDARLMRNINTPEQWQQCLPEVI